MPADKPSPRLPTVDLTTAFKDVAGDFIDSAKDAAELELFVGIGFVAWNVAVRGPAEADDMISTFIERIQCRTFRVRRATIEIRHKVLELAARKTRLYPELMAIIRDVEYQDRRDGLYLNVKRHSPV
jgi:hypothetical protein